MLTAIKIIGILLLVSLIGAYVLFKLLVRWLKKAADAGPTCPPCRINPEPEANPQWRNPELMQRFSAEFHEQGFQDAGAFSIPELGGLLMLAFVHPGERCYGSVYEHTKMAPTFDIGCEFPDETALTGTNTKLGGTLDARPGQTTLRLDQADVKTVFKAVLEKAGAAERKPVAAGEFVAQFKRSYIKGMNWRMKKGGVSRQEIRRQAVEKGQELTTEQLDEAYKTMREGYVTELRAGCLAQYLDEQQPKASEWELIQDRVLVIPETLTLEEVMEAIEYVGSLDDEQKHQLKQVTTSFGETAVDIIQRIVQQNIGALGLKMLGETQEPVRAAVLLFPDSEASEAAKG